MISPSSFPYDLAIFSARYLEALPEKIFTSVDMMVWFLGFLPQIEAAKLRIIDAMIKNIPADD
jgi:hypothetical protein